MIADAGIEGLILHEGVAITLALFAYLVKSSRLLMSSEKSYLEEVHSVSQSRERYLPRRWCYERSTCAAVRFQRGGHLLSLSLEKDNKQYTIIA